MQRLKFLAAVSTCSFGLVLLVGIVYAGSLSPSADPAATSYTLTDIYNRLTTNAAATAGNHSFAPSASPAGTLYTMTQVYDAIPTISGPKVLSGTTYLGVAGTLTGACLTSTFNGTTNLMTDANDGAGNGTNRWCMTNSGDATAGDLLSGKVAWVDGSAVTGTMATQTLSAGSATVNAGYYAATTLSAVDTDLTAGNILTGTTLFGITGTGRTRDYPGSGWDPNPSGDGSTDLTQATCEAASGWYWFQDANADGDSTDAADGICVQGTHQAAAGSWNGDESTTERDNTYIAAYTCSGNFPTGTVATYSGTGAGVADTTWNDGDCALCQADCYDGKKDLPDQGGYTSPMEDAAGHHGPITPEVLENWKGTRLPTSNDFFAFCGYKNGYVAGDNYETSCSSDTTHGSYGQMAGRTDECIDLSNSGGWEWLSEQNGGRYARIAGGNACSNFYYYNVSYAYRFRAVFRP